MDQSSLVEDWKISGEKFLEEFNQKYPVKTAFWLQGSEDSQWYLYVASEQVNDANLKAAYAEVLRAAKRLQGRYLDPFRVKVIRVGEPIVQAVLDIWNRHPGTMPIWYRGPLLGDTSIERAYLYPLSVTTP